MSNTVDTNGWHTVAAITYTDVNKAIEASATKPSSFTQAALDNSVSATGSFGAWLLRLGGSGPDIQMELEITGGSVTGPFGPSSAQATLPIAKCTYPIMLRAQYVPHIPGSSQQDLVPNGTQAVTVSSFDASKGTPTTNFLANAALQELLQEWLTANIGQFNAVFASVDLDADYTNEGVAWLKPSFKGYAVVEPSVGATLDNSVFAVMCLIDNAPAPTNLAFAVSPFAIPTGARAAFLISPDKFLLHMMLVACKEMFKGISQDDPLKHFTIDNDGLRIRNTGALTIPAVKLENGHVVEPTVDASNFTIAVDGTELVITISGMGFTFSPGIEVSLNYAGRSNLFYNTTNGVLDLKATTQTGSGSVTVTQGMQIAQIVLSVAAIVASVIAAGGGLVSKAVTTAVTTATEAAVETGEVVGEDVEQAEQVTVSALRGLLSGTPTEMAAVAARFSALAKVATVGAFALGLTPAVTGIMTAVADGNYQSLPKITDLTDGAIGKTVIWPKAVGEFKLASAQLNQALQFGLVAA